MRNDNNRWRLLRALLLGICVTLTAQAQLKLGHRSDPPVDEWSPETLLRDLSVPSSTSVQYDFIMTGRVRLLLFWAGADDVGGGYIRRGTRAHSPETRLIQVLFGSDPSKAPRHLNYWGAATEAIDSRSSILFGFMKSTKAGSAAEAEARIRKQNDQQQYAFEGIVSEVDTQRAVSRVVPLLSTVDFNLHQLEQAEHMIVEHLNKDESVRQLSRVDRKCESSRGFLQATDELIAHALRGGEVPKSLCYVYNARNYTATLEDRGEMTSKTIRVRRKDGTKIEKTYPDVFRAQFSTLNHQSGERTTFELWLGTTGELRGVPVQIVHQPNWWLQVILNLDSTHL